MNSYRIRYDEEDGSLEREGIVTPKGARVVMHNGSLIVCKMPGHGYFGGQGQPQNYAPAEFILVEEVYTDEERERANADDAVNPNIAWRHHGDTDGWINVRERMKWPVRS